MFQEIIKLQHPHKTLIAQDSYYSDRQVSSFSVQLTAKWCSVSGKTFRIIRLMDGCNHILRIQDLSQSCLSTKGDGRKQ
ncbi:hypothetical protein RIF29_08897 [Crotalaria pallida]|uniref:Uncharacterized protein n=1 Tax=Crotalaria pallida TaxID=3830 RepID=A0AAN9FU00_CROPI